MSGSALDDLGPPTAADGLRIQSPDNKGVERCVPATVSDHLTGEPLDERELRIMRILHHGKGCAVCMGSPYGSTPDTDTLAESLRGPVARH